MAVFPVGMQSTTTTEAHLATVYYTRVALDQLWKKFVYYGVFEEFTLPQHSGMSVQMHRYNSLAPNLTPTTEGDVGTSLTLSSRALRVSPSHFSSFITVSDFHQATAMDDQIAAASKQLGYRAGYSVDNLLRGVIDDQAPYMNQALLGANLTIADCRAVRHLLQGVDVQGWFNDNKFMAFVHPYVSYDVVNDPAANGLADISKYNTNVKDSPLFSYEDRGTLTEVAGCLIKETTSVFSQVVSSVTQYRSYFFGKGALGCVSLAGFAPSKVMDPKKENFKITTKKLEGTSGFDPVGVLAGYASYKFVMGATWLDGPEGIGGTFRARTIDAPSTIA